MAFLRRPFSLLLILLFSIAVVAIAVIWSVDRISEDEGLTGIAADVGPSVVIIELSDANRSWQWDVVAFLVEPGHLVTNRHCIEGASHGSVILPSGRRYSVKGIIADGGDLDVVFLKVDIPVRRAPRLRWGEIDPEPGDPIRFVQRDVEDRSAFSSEGRVLEVMEDQWSARRIIITSAPGDFGSSGSPLVNNRGEVVGVVYRGVVAGHQRTAAAVPISDIRQLALESPVSLADWWAPQETLGGPEARHHLQSAHRYESRNDLRAAIKHARLARQHAPEGWESAALLADFLFRSGQHINALLHAQRWSDLRPDDEGAWGLLALINYHLEDVPGAREAFQRSLARRTEGDPEHHSWIWQARTHRHFCTWGSLCLREGMLDEALTIYGQAAHASHECAATIAGLAIVSMHRGELHDAEQWIDRVAFLDADRGEHLRRLVAELREGLSPELPSAPRCYH